MKLFFEKIKVPAALLTGTLVASGLLQIFGLVEIFYLATKTNFFKDFKLNG